jgi:hypothetical protein
MTSQSPRIYTYKITFDEVPYYYYGVHKEKVFDEEYWGTPITNKWCWELYTPKKQILEVFDYADEGWLKAQEVEKRIIKPFYNDDKWCLNENCGYKTSIRICRENGIKCKENGKGIFSLSFQQRSENSKKYSKKAYENGLAKLSKEQLSENSKKIGLRHKENKTAVCGRTKEQMSEDGRKGGNKIKELGLGIFSFTPEQKSEYGKMGADIVNSQRWMCLETGFITNSGALTRYQTKRGIDTSKRKRIS